MSDPELIELSDDFAFDEVLAQSELNTQTRVLMILAALIGSQSVNDYRILAGAELTVSVTPVEIKQPNYQSVTYVGVAKAFEFIHAVNEVLSSQGVLLPL